jgi:HSP20 family protein
MSSQPPDPADPGNPLDDAMFFVADDLGDLFEAHRPFGRSETGFLGARSFRPSADVYESQDGLIISLEVPGTPREKIDITVQGTALVISGNREFHRESPNEEYVRLERGFGSFRRIFELPEDADTENVHARLEQGVLTITIPRNSSQTKVTIEPRGTFE